MSLQNNYSHNSNKRKNKYLYRNRIDIIMQTENIYSINKYMNSRQLKLFDFEMPRHKTPSLFQLSKNEKIDLTGNMMLDFVLTVYNYVKLTFKKYSSQYSKQKYTTQFFTILTYKITINTIIGTQQKI